MNVSTSTPAAGSRAGGVVDHGVNDHTAETVSGRSRRSSSAMRLIFVLDFTHAQRIGAVDVCEPDCLAPAWVEDLPRCRDSVRVPRMVGCWRLRRRIWARRRGRGACVWTHPVIREQSSSLARKTSGDGREGEWARRAD